MTMYDGEDYNAMSFIEPSKYFTATKLSHVRICGGMDGFSF